MRHINESLEENRKLAKELDEFLREQSAYYEVWAEEDAICVEVSWGDWKHDHLWLDYVAENFFNQNDYQIVGIDVETTEEDGSDTYSAIHTFTIAK